MRRHITATVFCLLSIAGFAQNKYWQQQANITINVSLNDVRHSLDGFETIEYINNSPDTLSFIWFHIWPNAYKNDRTAFSEQLLKLNRTNFYFSKPEDKGFINRLEFKADNATANIESDTNNIDIIKVLLPKPLMPGKKTVITTPFHVQLPKVFSRGGYINGDYQVTQWFPKPAVYDATGWHPMPYLDQGEFYSEFGNFDVEITAPSAFLIAATGVLQDNKTLDEIKQNGKHTVEGETKTWRFKESDIHDFAWFASKDFKAFYDTAKLETGKVVDVFSYYKPDTKAWKESVAFAKDGLRFYSNLIGEYPYSLVSVVQGAAAEASGGMEYPTITLITTQTGGADLDATIAHEIGHNWFYGILASNEREHPWMDEGINTYYQKRYELAKYGTYSYLQNVPKSFAKRLPDDEEALLLRIMSRTNKDQPIETASTEFTGLNYGLIAYYKASRWIKNIETELGAEVFDRCMRQYYLDWKFKHPNPEDFETSFEKVSGKDLNKIFMQRFSSGPIAAEQKRSIKLTALFNLQNTEKYDYMSFNPAFGYNYYDKFMLGLMLHNYQLPPTQFQFLAGALYATGSKKLNTLGRAGYTIYDKNKQLNASVSYINYTQDNFTFEDKTINQRVRRIVPSVTYKWNDRQPLSQRLYTVQWKTFLIKEDGLDFKTINTPAGPVTEVNALPASSYINRLAINMNDNRVLYPYNVSLVADQGKNSLRTGLTAKYFFNYNEKKQGLSARLFAGKFFHFNNNIISRFSNERYFLNMTGPSGREDYTYSDYFIGRNEFTGWMSQQIMERDGYFKVRTEMREVGKSDNWLTSLNLVTDLPGKTNPLSVLPIKIPIKLFLDVGTYAEAWQDNPATGRFIYDAGVQLSLLNSSVNIFVPIIYSKVYSDYYKSIVSDKIFLRSISFNINLQQFKNSLNPLGIPL